MIELQRAHILELLRELESTYGAIKSDDDLIKKVLDDTGMDINAISKTDAVDYITYLIRSVNIKCRRPVWRRPVWRKKH